MLSSVSQPHTEASVQEVWPHGTQMRLSSGVSSRILLLPLSLRILFYSSTIKRVLFLISLTPFWWSELFVARVS